MRRREGEGCGKMLPQTGGVTKVDGSMGRQVTGYGSGVTGSRSPYSRGVLSVEALLVGIHGEGHLDLLVGI